MVRVKDAESLMDLFAGTLGLPVSWPLQRSDFATYGWITVGNANLEFWVASNNNDLPDDQALPLFHGFALEPSDINESVAKLEKRRVKIKTPRPYVTKTGDGRSVTNFTNAVISDLSSSTCCIFFCEWGTEGTIFPWVERLTTIERKLKEQDLLSACAGGSAGVTGLVEVRMTTPDLVEYAMKWAAVTGQNRSINLGHGVDLILTHGKKVMIESIVLGVRSLDSARSFFLEKNLLGEDLGDEISISKEACAGLQIRFKQVKAV